MTFFKRTVAICLCLSQIALTWFCSGARASAGPTFPRQTPEFTLLENLAALQGQDLSPQGLDQRVGTLLTRYAGTATTEGQTDRLKQAMIDLHLATPAQATAFIARVDLAASRGTDINTTLGELLSSAPSGAQFSMCALGGGIVVGVSAFLLLVSLSLDKFASDYGDSPGTNRGDIIGGVGLAAGVGLIVAGAAGAC